MGIKLETNNHIVISDSPEGFANSMIKLFEDKDLRLRIGKNARALAKEKFDVAVLGNKISEFYNQLF